MKELVKMIWAVVFLVLFVGHDLLYYVAAFVAFMAVTRVLRRN